MTELLFHQEACVSSGETLTCKLWKQKINERLHFIYMWASSRWWQEKENPLKSCDASFCLLTRRQSSNFMILEGAVEELWGSVKRMWGVPWGHSGHTPFAPPLRCMDGIGHCSPLQSSELSQRRIQFKILCVGWGPRTDTNKKGSDTQLCDRRTGFACKPFFDTC